MNNKNAIDFIKQQNQNYELLEIVSVGLDIEELDSDEFTQKVKQEVKLIIFEIITREDLNGKNTIDSIDIVTKKFKEIIGDIVVENDIIKNIENGLGEELFKNQILTKKNGGYNVIYLNVLLSCMKDIMDLSKPIQEEQNLSLLQAQIIKLQMLNKIESLKSLNYLEYLLDGYISRLENSKQSLEIARQAIEQAKNTY